jgi:hypothetical protein
MTPEQAPYLSALKARQLAGERVEDISLSLLREIHGVQEDIAEDQASGQASPEALRYVDWFIGMAGHWLEAQRPARRRGRPAEAMYVRDAADFERRVIEQVRLIEKVEGLPATRGRVAKKLHIATRTLRNYCQRFGLDYQDLVHRARRG